MRVTYTLAGAPVPTNPADMLSAAFFKIAAPASTIPTLPTSGRLDIGSLTERGFDAHAVRPSAAAPIDFNSTANTEQVLAEATTWGGDNQAPWVCFIEPGIINYNHGDGNNPYASIGHIQPDKAFPGYLLKNYVENYALEMIGYVELQPGAYRWVVNSDDGFRVMCQTGTAVLRRHDRCCPG